MIAVAPAFVLKDKNIVQFRCDNCVCTVYKAFGGATVEMKDTANDLYVSWYPLDMELFRVNSENDIEAKDKLLLSCKEAAAMLNASEPTLRKMLDAGLIRHMEIRGVVKIYIFELHEFCKQMAGKSVDPYADDVVKEL